MRSRNLNYTVLISPQESDIISKLNDMGIKTIHTESVNELIEYERFHADMQVLIINDKAFICGNHSELADTLKTYCLKCEVCEGLSRKYPENILLNAALVGDKLICKKSSLSKKVKEYCESYGIILIDVKQGYSKCSTLVINDNAIITADKGIYEKSIEYGVEALLIKPGFIELDGTNYGFIGGCSGVVGDMVIFFGDINSHPDSRFIIDFICHYGMKPVSLQNRLPLKDVGGFVRLI